MVVGILEVGGGLTKREVSSPQLHMEGHHLTARERLTVPAEQDCAFEHVVCLVSAVNSFAAGSHRQHRRSGYPEVVTQSSESCTRSSCYLCFVQTDLKAPRLIGW